jgi:hypothetical protein
MYACMCATVPQSQHTAADGEVAECLANGLAPPSVSGCAAGTFPIFSPASAANGGWRLGVGGASCTATCAAAALGCIDAALHHHAASLRCAQA